MLFWYKKNPYGYNKKIFCIGTFNIWGPLVYSVKFLTEVQIYYIHSSSLIHSCNRCISMGGLLYDCSLFCFLCEQILAWYPLSQLFSTNQLNQIIRTSQSSQAMPRQAKLNIDLYCKKRSEACIEFFLFLGMITVVMVIKSWNWEMVYKYTVTVPSV